MTMFIVTSGHYFCKSTLARSHAMLLFSTEFYVFAWLLSSNFIYAHIIMHTDIKYAFIAIIVFLFIAHARLQSAVIRVNKSDEKWCEYNMCQSEYRF